MLRSFGESLRQYLAACLRQAWFVAGAMLAAVDLYTWAGGHPVFPQWIRVVIYVILGIIVPFLAFHQMRLDRDQMRLDRDGLREELRAFQGPVISGEIEIMAIAGRAHTDLGAGTPTFLVLAIRNQGAPSILTDWHVYLSRPDRERTELPLVHHEGTLTFELESSQAIRVAKEDFIYNKVTVSPIEQGGQRKGFLVCLLPPGLERDDILRDPSQLTVACRDVAGLEHSFQAAAGGSIHSSPVFIPGLQTFQIVPKT